MSDHLGEARAKAQWLQDAMQGRGENVAAQAILHLADAIEELQQRQAPTPAPEQCQACGGRGSWETECCNGAHGCPCRGGRVDMGSCRACGGVGFVQPGHQSPAANANYIMSNHISYPGGGPR